MNFIQEVLNLLERKQDKKKLDLRRDWFEFGRTRPSSVGNPLYTPKMNPHAIKFSDLKCNIISGLVSGTGTEHTLPVWSTVDTDNCNVQTIIDSVFSQDAPASEGKVTADFRVTGNTVLEGDLLVLGTQTIVESTIVEVADNIMRINSGGAGVDAGIEVIQPSGTKTWAWDNGKGMWSTFDDSIITKDITIGRALIQDGETLVNVVNEAEGLASQDNDESLATVAAIIDWSDQMDLDVVADTGIPLDILLNSETLQIRGGKNITTHADGAEKIRIDLDDDIFVNSVTSKFLTLQGAPGDYTVTSIVNDYTSIVDHNDTLLTAKAIFEYVNSERDFINNVQLNGTSLDFTGTNNAFTGSVDLSSFLDDTNLSRIVSGALSGTDLVLTRDDATDFTVDLSGLSNNVPVMSATVTGTGKLRFDDVQPEPAVAVSSIADRTYGVQFNDAEQLVVNVPWVDTTGSVVIANPGSPTADLTSISIDGIVYGIAAPTSADGNDFISDVSYDPASKILDFTGTGGAFNGQISLLGLAGGNYTASDGIVLSGANDFSLVDVTRANTSNGDTTLNHTDAFTVIDDITTNAKGQVTSVNVKTLTLPASGTGADGVITDVALNANSLDFTGSNGGFNGSIDLSAYENAVDQNDIDYVSQVSLTNDNLVFSGTGNAFSGSIDLSPYNNLPETLTSLSVNANVLTYRDEAGANTDIDLSLYLDDTNLARLTSGTLDAASGVATFTRDDASTFTLDLSSLLDTDTNDIDFVSGVSLSGTDLTFTGTGNAFAGTIDLSSLGGTDTNTTYDLSSRQNVNDVDISLSASAGPTDVVKLIAGTNITLTDTNNNITIDASGGSTIACQSGIGVANSTQSLTSTYTSVGQGQTSFLLGFKNTSGAARDYAITWSIQYSMTGISGVKAFDTEISAVGIGQLIEFNDSAYMVSEHPVTKTYTYNVTGLADQQEIVVNVKGDANLTIDKAHLNVVVTDCEALNAGEISLLGNRPGDGDDPNPEDVYVGTQYRTGTCDLGTETINVRGDFTIGDVVLYNGQCYELTEVSRDTLGVTPVSTFRTCEECRQMQP